LANVFISYRRKDTAWPAAYLRLAIECELGPNAVFMDKTDIHGGEDFKSRIGAAIKNASVVVALIGDGWAGERVPYVPPSNSSDVTKNGIMLVKTLHATFTPDKPEYSVRRLETEDDMVRFELTKAFKLRKQVVPVLVDGASLPTDFVLPNPLDKLKTLHQIKLGHNSAFENIPTVINAIRRHLL